MAETIYEIHLWRRTEAWYQLSKKEQEDYIAKVSKLPTQSGAKSVLNGKRAISGEWDFFGVYEYPDIETREKLIEILEEQQFFRYFEVKFVLGRELKL